jgi:hypothetical protein
MIPRHNNDQGGCELTDQSVAQGLAVTLPVGRRPHIIKGLRLLKHAGKEIVETSGC